MIRLILQQQKGIRLAGVGTAEKLWGRIASRN